MTKEVWFEIARRSWRLATSLMVVSLGSLLTAGADAFWVILGTILAPVLTVLGTLVVVWYNNRGKVTLTDVDKEFDKVDPVKE